jgi:hypothetical protein
VAVAEESISSSNNIPVFFDGVRALALELVDKSEVGLDIKC